MSDILPDPPSRSPAAERMRRYRQRRRDGMRCFTVEIRETEIDALIRKGLLKQESRNNCNEILHGLYAVLEQALDSEP